ncbi:MAG: hypothetical protein EOL87_10555 [Spartobacteria bacterium]|nr:hypothetical protein [Spartobacteria bacterium]
MKMIQSIPSMITAGALVAGIFSILKSIEGDFSLAAQLIMLSMILDGFDGNVARWLKVTSDFGAELDTFVDLTSFGIAPAILMYQMVFNNLGAWGLFFVCFTILSGALRLARFKVVDPARGMNGFLGLPITVNAGWVAMAVFITESGILNEEWFTLTSGPVAVFVWISSFAMLLLQVSHVHYAKPTKNVCYFTMCVFTVLLLFMRVHIATAAATAICAYGFVYTFVLPVVRVIHSPAIEQETLI